MLRIDEDAETSSWTLYPLFKRDQTKHIRIWQIAFDKKSKQLVRTMGVLGYVEDLVKFNKNNKVSIGEVLSELVPDFSYLKNADIIEKNYTNLSHSYKVITPKVNRTLQQQALLQARSEYKKKVRDGMVVVMDLNEFLNGDIQAPFKPQLAKVYKFPDDKDHNKNHITDKQFKTGLVCQQKEDGHRGIAHTHPKVEFYTRRNKIYSWLELQKAQVKILAKYLPLGTIIDGELTHKDGVQTAASIIKSISDRDERMDEVIYNIFDVYVPNAEYTLEQRIKMLDEAWSDYVGNKKYVKGVIRRLKNTYIYDIESLKRFSDKVTSKGLEGIVIRKLAGEKPNAASIKSSLYTCDRNANLLKAKPFEDEEGIIIDVIRKDSGSVSHEKCALFVIKKGHNTFKCTPHGTLEQKKYWYKHPKECIGRIYTYKFSQRTDSGKPKCAAGIDFRDDMD